LYGRYDLLERLRAYRVRPAPALPPGKFETGTGNFEGISGLLGALNYLEWVGLTFGSEHAELFTEAFSGRRLIFKQAMSAIRAYEFELSRALLGALQSVSGIRLFGPSDPSRLDLRVPTFSFTLHGHSPRQVAQFMAEHSINVWDGNFYALAVTERLGLEESGGLVRIGAVHYNTLGEIEQFKDVLQKLVS